MAEVVQVGDPYSGFTAFYIDGKLVADYDYDPFPNDVLEVILDGLPGIEFDSVSKHQLARELRGFDYVEYEGYWPESFADLPTCTTEGCCVWPDKPSAPCCTDTLGMPVPCQHG